MLKFIVTGGTSFIGRQVVKQIVNNGDFVYVICRKESPSIKYLPNNDLVKIIYLDFNNIDGLNKIINQADIFLNLAWTGGTQKTGDGSLQMNIQEFAPIHHNNLPIKTFILNNNGYLLIRSTQKNFMGRYIGEGPETGV